MDSEKSTNLFKIKKKLIFNYLQWGHPPPPPRGAKSCSTQNRNPSSSVLPQEGCTILRALLYQLSNKISKLYYRFHTTMKQFFFNVRFFWNLITI